MPLNLRRLWDQLLLLASTVLGAEAGKAKLPCRSPLDPFPYERHPASRPFSPAIESGVYVFVQDKDGIVHVVPETEGHLHPRVLGGAAPAAAAGGLQVASGGVILEIDNFSGTFQFGPEVLPQVRSALLQQGAVVRPDAEKPFSY